MKETPNPDGHYTLEEFERETGTDNVSGIDPVGADRKQRTTKLKMVRIPDAPDMRLTKPILIHVTGAAHSLIKRMARQNGCPIGLEASKAITYWVYYLAKIARAESTDKDAVAVDTQIKECEKILEDIRMEQYISMLKRRKSGVKITADMSRRAWARLYPGKPWPGVQRRPVDRHSSAKR